ncbi:hypothetical protein HanHA300_Chr09g0327671 [Helianthus annuus]|nr:hypothetical protein HanHA300_Chr09g0327671 [Helianthus annuus]KAJ0543240.1 hypothetical protein HanHA89_Chr09g0348591 [Helianthus annuus]KAJ0708297.1 hypothetical protein HanLR1_Chr09g0327931 [Helianthus annuus]KAJ0712243.1 hypothetical protein HanOQP8_Chr09g0332731 [Helianthus annuus]
MMFDLLAFACVSVVVVVVVQDSKTGQYSVTTCEVLMKKLKKIVRKEILVVGSSQKVAWLEHCYRTNLDHADYGPVVGSSFDFVTIR